MSLPAGTRLGPYEIVSPIGAGGMGEVYRARDTRLERDVAIKVLPPALATDPQFKERFEREAKSISSLNHPNICTLYDVGEGSVPGHAAGLAPAVVSYLVMEFLEGETLVSRLAQGPLPLTDALKIAVEIAGALDKAHRQGIVHRDLKPGNVMLTKTGAKLLDFGLAKVGPAGVLSGVAPTVLATSPRPTAASPALTAQGTILGTFQYMAPEQVEGDETDPRSDIFAFGALLYEMFTGRKAFSGKSQASLLGAILKDDPPPVSQVQPLAPPALDYLVRTCLAKDPDARFQTAHDLLLQLKWIAEGGSAAGVPAPVVAHRRSRERLAWIAVASLGAALLVTGTMAVMHLGEAAPVAEPIQFTIGSPEGSLFGGQSPQIALSPDGRQIAFVASFQSSTRVVWVRPLGSVVARALTGTDDASYPFWSADGRFIGFFSGGKLKKVQVSGGPPVTLCDAPSARGGTWNEDNVILFTPQSSGPIQRITSAGGVPTALTELRTTEPSHRWPAFLPDGVHYLYFAGTPPAAGEIRLGRLDEASSEAPTIGSADSGAQFSAGHVLFLRSGTLMAQALDSANWQPGGDPFPVAQQVSLDSLQYGSFSASPGGALIYGSGSTRPSARLTWRDRTGKPLGTAGDPGEYFNMSLSPDERRVAVSVAAGAGGNRDVWVIDLTRAGTLARFTFDPAGEGLPIWSPDGATIAYASTRTGAWNLFTKSSSGGGQEEAALKSATTNFPSDWSRDQRFLVFTDQTATTGYDIGVLPLSGERKPIVFLQTPFNEDNPVFSPDGKWVAYDSNESGRTEVYVRPFPTAPGQYMVSRDGGSQPQWRDDGKELFFIAPDARLMAADIGTAKEFQASVPKALFESGIAMTGNRRQYAVARGGQRFLVIVPERRSNPLPLTVVVNWPAALQK